MHRSHATQLASKSQRKCPEFQRFCQQLYHKCLEVIFEPLRQCMTAPTVVKCPDGQFRRAIFGLGPYIADYLNKFGLWELSQIGVQSTSSTIEINCTCKPFRRCDATPDDLDSGMGHRQTHEKTDYLIKNFNSKTL